jgi:hypothetical protein
MRLVRADAIRIIWTMPKGGPPDFFLPTYTKKQVRCYGLLALLQGIAGAPVKANSRRRNVTKPLVPVAA